MLLFLTPVSHPFSYVGTKQHSRCPFQQLHGTVCQSGKTLLPLSLFSHTFFWDLFSTIYFITSVLNFSDFPSGQLLNILLSDFKTSCSMATVWLKVVCLFLFRVPSDECCTFTDIVNANEPLKLSVIGDIWYNFKVRQAWTLITSVKCCNNVHNLTFVFFSFGYFIF